MENKRWEWTQVCVYNGSEKKQKLKPYFKRILEK